MKDPIFYNQENRTIQDVIGDIASICLHQIMYNTYASTEMHKANIQSLKRVHRYLSKKFHCIYFNLVNNSVNNYDFVPENKTEFVVYKAKSLKNHLLHRQDLLEGQIQTLGELSKEFFNLTGTTCETIKEMLKSMLRSLNKTRRTIQRFDFTDWMPHDIEVWDYHLHKKMKKVEAEKDGFTI